MLLAAGCLLVVTATGAAERRVAAGAGTLQQAIAAAAAGDTLRLGRGRFAGNFVVDRPLALVGEPGTLLDGEGRGRVVTLAAPGTRLAGVTLVGSGSCLACEDGAVYLTAAATGALVEGNTLDGNLIGINLKGTRDALVRGNRITGRADLPMSERGNGVQLWDAPGSVVVGNEIRHGRDGIFVTTSRANRFVGNRMQQLRFAVHYMYTNDSEIRDNVSLGNHLGYALMFSHR
ncbi:MAG TPA: NosD domain-containing protein, partial [Gammaproteobacteria bacterium]